MKPSWTIWQSRHQRIPDNHAATAWLVIWAGIRLEIIMLRKFPIILLFYSQFISLLFSINLCYYSCIILVIIILCTCSCTFRAYYGGEFAGAIPHRMAYFGQGSGPVHVGAAQCNGSEQRIVDCTLTTERQLCSQWGCCSVECSGENVDLFFNLHALDIVIIYIPYYLFSSLYSRGWSKTHW